MELENPSITYVQESKGPLQRDIDMYILIVLPIMAMSLGSGGGRFSRIIGNWG
jgi:hypothetical protein